MRARILAAMTMLLVITTTVVMFSASRTHEQAVERPMAAMLDAHAGVVASTAADSADLATMQRRLGGHVINLSITTRDGREIGAPLPKDLNDTAYRFRVVPIDGGGELDRATATLWVTADQVLADHRTLQRLLVLVGVVSVIAAMLLAVLVTGAVLRPLDELVDRARRIGSGERGIRMGETIGPPEIEKTARAIDHMLDDLERSERKATEAEMDAVEAHAKMQVFLADAAHELRTPLAGIKAAAEALMHLPANAASAERENLEFLLAREANRGGQLVTSLLEAAKAEAAVHLRPVALEVMPLLDNERRRLQLALPALDVQVDGVDAVAMVDRHGYTSVLRNLIENAVTAAGPQGWVRIHCGYVTRAGRSMVEVTVVDSGAGIPQADRERVFDRMVRLSSTAPSTNGSGLGLAIARGYARALGGDVVHGSTPPDADLPGPQGAVFVARVPAG